MRAYKVTGLGGGPRVAFAGSQGDASKARRAMAEKYNLRPQAEVTVEEVEIPTSKVDLLAFLNSLVGAT